MSLVFIALLIWAPRVLLGFICLVIAVCILSAIIDGISGLFHCDKPKEIKPLPWQKDRRLICNKPIYYHNKTER